MKKNLILQIYLAAVSVIALIVVAINLSILLSRLLSFYLISWEEYKVQHQREIQAPCEKTITPSLTWEIQVSPECQKQNEQKLKIKRQLEVKQALIGNLPPALIFLIIFIVHYWWWKKIVAEQK